MIDLVFSWRPSLWFDYLLLYTTPGVVLFIAIVSRNTIREKQTDFAKKVTKLLGKKPSLKDHLQEMAIYLLALIFMLIGWPGFLIWYLKDKINEKKLETRQDFSNFECAPQYLLNQVTREEVESMNHVFDPLGKVPPRPFGHLNHAWEKFLFTTIDEKEELWSFSIPKGNKFRKHRFECTADIHGYAKVLEGNILAEFIFETN